MSKSLFTVFLIMHVLGDFYFQSNKLSDNKQKEYRFVVVHSIIYLLISCILVIPFWSFTLLISAAALALSHFVVDSVKFLYLQGRDGNYAIFAIDQSIHICLIFVAVSVLLNTNYTLSLSPAMNRLVSAFTKEPGTLLLWAGLLLMADKPANITIKQMVSKYKPGKVTYKDSNNAGAFIGTLERIIILLLLSVSQYSAIGAALTAKSVARYNKISEDKEFAEYYLLGTLLSTLYAIGTYQLLK